MIIMNRNNRRRILAGVVCLVFFCLFSTASAQSVALKNGKLFTGTGRVIENCTVLIKNGKIAAFGVDVSLPDECKVIDASGKYITPGLVIGHSWAGMQPYIAETKDPVNPQLRILDAIDFYSEDFDWYIRGGVTSVVVSPAATGIITGTCVFLKTGGKSLSKRIIKDPVALKINVGEEPKAIFSAKNQLPSSRMGIRYLLEKTLDEAVEYVESGKRDDPKMDILALIIKRKIPAVIHCNRHDDILMAISIVQKYGLWAIFDHCFEGYKVTDEIAAAGIPVLTTTMQTMWKKWEKMDFRADNSAILTKAAITVAVHPGDGCPYHGMAISLLAGRQLAYGLSHEQVLRSITYNPALIFNVEDRVGSIEKGKDADIVIWTGDLFEPSSKPAIVFIDGQIVFQRMH